MSGHSDFGIFQQFVSIFRFYLGVKSVAASASCPSQPWNLEMISMILVSFEMLKILVQRMLCKILNRLLQHHLGVQT